MFAFFVSFLFEVPVAFIYIKISYLTQKTTPSVSADMTLLNGILLLLCCRY